MYSKELGTETFPWDEEWVKVIICVGKIVKVFDNWDYAAGSGKRSKAGTRRRTESERATERERKMIKRVADLHELFGKVARTVWRQRAAWPSLSLQRRGSLRAPNITATAIPALTVEILFVGPVLSPTICITC